MKKFFCCLASLFLLCALFHKQILGVALQSALKMGCGCELATRSIHWEGGELIFSDLVVFDSSFHAYIDRIAVRFDWKSWPKKGKVHLTIDRPHLSIMRPRDLPKLEKGWLDVSVSVSEGQLDWDGPVSFSLEHREELSELRLNWADAAVFLTVCEGQWEAELKEFKAPLLQEKFPFGKLLDGRVTGRVAVNEKGEWTSVRLDVSKGAIAVPMGSVENIEGSLSYHATLGAKWEFEGQGHACGKQFPFHWEGRGVFKSDWLETTLCFEEAFCKVSRAKMWDLEVQGLRFEHLTLLQAGIATLYPEAGLWHLTEGSVSGKGAFSSLSWNGSFEAKNLTLKKERVSLSCDTARGEFTQDGGSLVVRGREYDLQAAGTWDQWNAQAHLGPLELALRGGWDGEKFPIQIEKGECGDVQLLGSGWVDPNLDLFLNLEGSARVAGREFPFYCPQLSNQGGDWAFDLRFLRKTWDLLRIVGTSDGKTVLYNEKSHFLGSPLHFASSEIGALDVRAQLPWEALLSAGPLLKECGFDLKILPPLSGVEIHLLYGQGKTALSAKGASPAFEFSAEGAEGQWKFDLASDLAVQAVLQKDGTAKGKGSWKQGLRVEFEGKIDPSLQCEFALPKVWFDLAEMKDPRIEGILEGQGHLVYKGQVESDLDFSLSSLKIHSHSLENAGPIHLYYSSTKGALFRGIELHGPFDCKVDLLEYDARRSYWIFHSAQVHLPGSWLTHRLLQGLDRERDLDFTAHLEVASDLSTFACTMREGFIPFKGASHQIQNVSFSWAEQEGRGRCKAALHYLDHLYQIHLQIDDRITGRLILGEEEHPLAIDWEYEDGMILQSIEGSFCGVEASFHAEGPNNLIGTARVNFTTLSPLLPRKVAEVFEEIKMGAGYELKGRLKMENNIPLFSGLLSGKQLELFGFQFRTLLGQVDLSPERIQIHNLKVSDSAGMMKIDEILLEGKEEKPWTIAIPTLSIQELRPSLLQRPGQSTGAISPLVVRKLTLLDFKGLLEEGKTYTAKGDLHFINSYKREESVFDLPANVLSRIVGLDLELLIPVTGHLEFELQDGLFNLTELSDAYSEGKRSQFFLEMDPQPTMDLDGNLNIFIKMKQFVLLKITESFLISIGGQLDDPEFHLQKKRFFGLM